MRVGFEVVALVEVDRVHLFGGHELHDVNGAAGRQRQRGEGLVREYDRFGGGELVTLCHVFVAHFVGRTGQAQRVDEVIGQRRGRSTTITGIPAAHRRRTYVSETLPLERATVRRDDDVAHQLTTTPAARRFHVIGDAHSDEYRSG